MNLREYLFNLVMEEASEIAQAASKCNRFTPDHTYGKYSSSNLVRLGVELNDLFTVISLLEKELGVIFEKTPNKFKLDKVEKYMKISKELGALEE